MRAEDVGGESISDRHEPTSRALCSAAALNAVREAPAIVVLGTLSELTLGDDVGASDGFDGFGVS